jgi:hypothetical protein
MNGHAMGRRPSRAPRGGGGASGRCRAGLLAVALIQATSAFETGVHSAHHLAGHDDPTPWAVAGAAGPLARASAEPVQVEALALSSFGGPVAMSQCEPPISALSPHQGRAPPITR